MKCCVENDGTVGRPPSRWRGCLGAGAAPPSIAERTTPTHIAHPGGDPHSKSEVWFLPISYQFLSTAVKLKNHKMNQIMNWGLYRLVWGLEQTGSRVPGTPLGNAEGLPFPCREQHGGSNGEVQEFILEPLICIYGSVWQDPSLGKTHAPATRGRHGWEVSMFRNM